MFLTEKELRDTFWENYNRKNRAKKWQFECPVRDGNADLLTIEEFQKNWQINAFEFKLNDIKKFSYRRKVIFRSVIKAGL